MKALNATPADVRDTLEAMRDDFQKQLTGQRSVMLSSSEYNRFRALSECARLRGLIAEIESALADLPKHA